MVDTGFKNELDSSRNRSMEKTFIFKNIKPHTFCESWEESKLLLANELKEITPECILDYVTLKIERAHQANENCSTNSKIQRLVTCRLNQNWSCKKIQNTKHSTNLYLTNELKSLWTLQNQAMKKGKQLKDKDPELQAYVKYSFKLMIKRTGESKYTCYQEFWECCGSGRYVLREF